MIPRNDASRAEHQAQTVHAAADVSGPDARDIVGVYWTIMMPVVVIMFASSLFLLWRSR
jgi:hypothetical protein